MNPFVFSVSVSIALFILTVFVTKRPNRPYIDSENTIVYLLVSFSGFLLSFVAYNQFNLPSGSSDIKLNQPTAPF